MRGLSKLNFANLAATANALTGGPARAAILAVLFLVAVPVTAHADICSSLRAQLGGASSRNPAVAQFNRQLAAIRALERRHNCTGSEAGGFFSACGGLAAQRADVQRKIANAGSGGFFGANRNASIRARMASLGCGEDEPRKRQQVVTWSSDRLPGGNSMLFCVRLTDGYFFPTPNSQFVGKDDDYKNTLDRCQYICDEKEMDVYALGDIGFESEEMISIKGRKVYKDLPTAFAYRESADFKACDLQRYYRRVNEARARTVTPGNMANAIIPLPAPRPEQPTAQSLPTEATAFAAQPVPIDPAKKVRVVGDPFLPLE